MKQWYRCLSKTREIVPPEDFACALPANYSDYGIREQDLYALSSDEQFAKLFCCAPFDGNEEAVLALQVRSEEAVLDIFGLVGSRREGLVYPGDLAFTLKGREDSLRSTLDKARRWWGTMAGKPLPLGRPRDTGTWTSREDFRTALCQAVKEARSSRGNATQEQIACHLNTSTRQLKRWLDRYDLSWQEAKSL